MFVDRLIPPMRHSWPEKALIFGRLCWYIRVVTKCCAGRLSKLCAVTHATPSLLGWVRRLSLCETAQIQLAAPVGTAVLFRSSDALASPLPPA